MITEDESVNSDSMALMICDVIRLELAFGFVEEMSPGTLLKLSLPRVPKRDTPG